MKIVNHICAVIVLVGLGAGSAGAAVRVTSEPPATPEAPAANPPAATASVSGETRVVFRTSANQYVTANASGVVDVTGAKIGSKQMFTIIDSSGGVLDAGHQVRIRYNPHTSPSDPPKSNFWHETSEGPIKRGRDGDLFKIVRVGEKYALQGPDGKYVGVATGDFLMVAVEKRESATLLDILDPKGNPVIKVAEKTDARPATTESAPTPAAPPPASKPATP